eukprot:9158273-Ditylum_brightwellii.AAC.5
MKSLIIILKSGCTTYVKSLCVSDPNSLCRTWTRHPVSLCIGFNSGVQQCSHKLLLDPGYCQVKLNTLYPFGVSVRKLFDVYRDEDITVLVID